MKIRNILSIVLASSALIVGCAKDPATDSFENIKLDKTFVTIPSDGGDAVLTITATEEWKFVIDDKWPEVLKWNDGVKAKYDFYGNVTNADEANIKSKEASWAQSSVLSGAAGETKVTFTADKFAGGRELSLAIVCGTHKQHFKVRQGDLAPETVSIADAIASPVGKNVRVNGKVQSIANTTYGNWYITDGKNSLYIYGTLDKEGKEKNFSSWGLEVGDEITVEGPVGEYNGSKQLVNVTVVELNKSLAKVVTEPKEVALEGGKLDIEVEYKGVGLDPVVPEAYRSWISIIGMTSQIQEPTKLDPNPAIKGIVTISVQPNDGGDRKGSIEFVSSKQDEETKKISSSKVTYEFTQKGAVITASVDEFLAAKESETLYRVTGVITKIEASSKYHNAEITVASGDFTKTVLLHRAIVEDGNIEDKNYAVGDIITVLGKRSSYNGAPQMAEKCVVEKCEHYAAKTISEFLELPVAASPLFAVSGTITALKDMSESYNNVGITIEADGKTLYCHRVQTYDKPKTNVVNLGLKVGDKITIAGARGEYNNAAQMAQYGVVIAYTPAE